MLRNIFRCTLNYNLSTFITSVRSKITKQEE